MFKRIVNIVEMATLAATVAFVVLLFTVRPAPFPTAAGASGAEPPGGPGATVLAVPPEHRADGAAIFANKCSGCHGGSGEGAFGPRLSGGRAVERFPDAADQRRVVENGRGSMPAFGASLTAEQIAVVVEFTRTL